MIYLNVDTDYRAGGLEEQSAGPKSPANHRAIEKNDRHTARQLIADLRLFVNSKDKKPDLVKLFCLDRKKSRFLAVLYRRCEIRVSLVWPT